METPIIIDFTRDDLKKLYRFVTAVMLGGTSRVRADEERKEKLGVDQWVGQIGECGLSRYLTGSDEAYIKTRQHKNQNPHVGDKGWDLLDYPVDIKTTNAHFSNLSLTDYNLVVPKPEFHKVIYVLGLVKHRLGGVRLYLMGWAPFTKVEYGWNLDGRFPYKYTLNNKRLRTMRNCKSGIKAFKTFLAPKLNG